MMVTARLYDVDAFSLLQESPGEREVVLRMAGLARQGLLERFVGVVESDDELDPDTKDWVLTLASNEPFLIAADEYFARLAAVN